MAEDRKSDHYTSAEGYRDLDGLHKTFTFIDHDKKPKISTSCLSEQEVSVLNTTVKEDIIHSIEEILALPAVSFLSSGNFLAEDFIERDAVGNKIKWRKKMVKDALAIDHNLRYNVWIQTWKNTVREQYWFEEMSHQDILDGKWREWI